MDDQRPGPAGARLLIDFSAFVAERTSRFAGREWCLDAVDDWLHERRPRAFFIVGEPGSGKTALAARLFEISRGDAASGRPELAHGFLSAVHFCSAHDLQWSDPILFAKSISLQLAGSCPGFAESLLAETGGERVKIDVKQTVHRVESSEVAAVVIRQLVVGDVTPEHAFTQLVAGPLARVLDAQPDCRVVIMVDALDESLVWPSTGIAKLLALTQRFPEGCRLIISSRPEERFSARSVGLASANSPCRRIVSVGSTTTWSCSRHNGSPPACANASRRHSAKLASHSYSPNARTGSSCTHVTCWR
jgi:AAA ATPase domain